MSLDRVITVQTFSEGAYDNMRGEYTEGSILTNRREWASLEDRGVSYVLTASGTIATWLRAYIIRYRADFVARLPDGAPALRPGLIKLWDEYGRSWRVESFSESEYRHRFITVEVIRTPVEQLEDTGG